MCADRTAGARNRGEQGAGGADRREGCRSCRVATVPALRHGGYRQAWPGREWSAAVSLPVAAWLRSHLQRADEYAACTNAQARGLAGLCRGTRRAAVTRLGSCASGHRPPDRLAVTSILLGLKPDGAGVTVVGDDAQALYALRSATVRNILDFSSRFDPPAAIVRLEQNYRSTKPILAACNRIIARAGEGFSKNLFTTRSDGGRPILAMVADETLDRPDADRKR